MTCVQSKGATADGHCSPVPPGQDPNKACTPQGGCGNTGTCDGKGNCSNAATTTQCGTQCDPNAPSMQDTLYCNGTGLCSVAGPATACKNNVSCQDGGCPSTCTTDDECVTGYHCKQPSCVLLANPGQACIDTTDCANGNACVGGACCNVAECQSGCHTCAVAGGACAVAVSDTDFCPRSAPCGYDGLCNPDGECHYPDTTTLCPGTCSTVSLRRTRAMETAGAR